MCCRGAFHQSCIQCRIFDTKDTVLTCNCYRDFAKSSSVILSQVTLSKLLSLFASSSLPLYIKDRELPC